MVKPKNLKCTIVFFHNFIKQMLFSAETLVWVVVHDERVNKISIFKGHNMNCHTKTTLKHVLVKELVFCMEYGSTFAPPPPQQIS
jgi:hypothetical protein